MIAFDHQPFAAEMRQVEPLGDQEERVSGGCVAAEHDRSRLERYNRAGAYHRARSDLERYAAFADGWCGVGSASIPPRVVKEAAFVLQYLDFFGHPAPRVVPTADAGIQLEWFVGDRELEVELVAPGRVECLLTGGEAGPGEEVRLDGLDVRAIEELVARVTRA